MTESTTRWTAPRRLPILLAVGASLLAIAHAVVVGRHYNMGSFDDDAGYVLVARALAHGHGLTGTLPAGYPLISSYPPGYPALLAPVARVDGTAFLAFRAISLMMLAGLFPLVWSYLGRRGLPDLLRVAVLVVLALNPVLATFSTMVMAEVPFLVCLIILMLVAERWEAQRRAWSWAGLATVLTAAYAVWLKEAAAGLVLGLVLWLGIKAWRKGAIAAVGVLLFLSPIAIARVAIGGSLLGSRYSDEFGGAFAGGIGHQLTHAIPHAIATYVNLALPQTIAPTSVSPLPIFGGAAGALGTFGTLITPLVLIGFAVWAFRFRDAVSVAVPVYLLETLVYPFTNERRLILIVPFLAAWFVLGGREVFGWLRWIGRRVARAEAVVPAVAAATALVYAGILLPQFGRDYLFALGQDSSHPQGSPYMSLLSRLGSPADTVESDYVWTTNLFTRRRAAESAFFASEAECFGPHVIGSLEQDRAGFVLSAILSNVQAVPSPCLLALLGGSAQAVRLLRTAQDDASVFELIGPGTPHPGLRDALAAAQVTAAGLESAPPIPQAPGDVVGTVWSADSVDGKAALTWTFPRTAISQVTVGMVGADDGPTGSVVVELLTPDGAWRRVTGSTGRPPYLLATLDPPVTATALRVTVGAAGRVSVLDIHALGS